MPHTHPDVFPDQGGKAIRATTKEGFLSYGPYIEGLPSKALDVYFSLQVDNNTADNRHIFTIDIYDSFNQKILGEKGYYPARIFGGRTICLVQIIIHSAGAIQTRIQDSL